MGLIIGAALLLMLAVAVIAAWRHRATAPTPSVGLPEENATLPYDAEMHCIDRVLQNPNLKAPDVQPALDACRGSPADGNRSAGQ